MKFSKKHFNILNIYLIIFFISLIYVSLNFSDGLLEHKTPGPFFHARDTLYSSQLITDLVDNNAFVRSSYLTNGMAAYYYRPPIFGTTGAILQNFTGINEYDIGFFIVLFSVFLMILIMYLLISKYSKTLALFSLPLSLVFFKMPFSAAITWGRWPSTLNVLFLLIAVLFYSYRRFESPIILGSLLGFGFMTHFKESIYFSIIFIPLLLLYEFFSKSLNKRQILNFFKSYLTAFLIFLGFLPFALFMITKTQLEQKFFNYIAISTSRVDIPLLSSFSFIKWFLLLGFVLGLFLLYKNKKRNFDIPVLFGIYFVIITFVGLIFTPFYKGITQNRFFWPIILSLFLGIVVYFIFVQIKSKIDISENISSGIFFILVLLLIFTTFNFEKQNTYVITNEKTWESLNWITKNTPEEATFLTLYGDNLGMDAIHWVSKRNFHIVSPEDYYGAINNEEAKFYFKPHTIENFAIRKGFYDFEIHHPNEGFENLSLCNFDYLYFNKQSYQPVLSQYTLILANELINKKNFSVVYDNDFSVILRNPNLSFECLETFKLK